MRVVNIAGVSYMGALFSLGGNMTYRSLTNVIGAVTIILCAVTIVYVLN